MSHLSDQRYLSAPRRLSAQDDRQLVVVEMAFEADPFPLNSLVTAHCSNTEPAEALQVGKRGLHRAFIFQQPLGLGFIWKGARTLMRTHKY